MISFEPMDILERLTSDSEPSPQRKLTQQQKLRAAVREMLRLDQVLLLEVPDDTRWSHVWLEPILIDALYREEQVVIVGATQDRLDRLLKVEPQSIQQKLNHSCTVAGHFLSKQPVEPSILSFQNSEASTVVVTDYPTLFASFTSHQAKNRVLVLLEAHAIHNFATQHVSTQRSLKGTGSAQVARMLASLFDARAVLLVSDTLAVGGGFDATRLELGIPESSKELVIVHPRGERPRLLLVVPEFIPLPGEGGWPGAVASLFLKTVQTTQGAVVGCSASPATETGIRELFKRLQLSIEVEHLVDGRAEFHPVGLPTALHRPACVFLDRLPFRAPVTQLERANPEDFHHLGVHRAVRTFRRAARHLLYSGARHTVMVVCDKRILTRAYARFFTDALPGVTISRSMQDVASFLAGKEISR